MKFRRGGDGNDADANWHELGGEDDDHKVLHGLWWNRRQVGSHGEGGAVALNAGTLPAARPEEIRQEAGSPQPGYFIAIWERVAKSPMKKRGANTFEGVVEKTGHAGLETCEPKLGLPTAGWEACATTLEYRRVSRRMVARLQRLMATVAANPGRCPGLSCGGLSGLVFAPPFWKKEAMDLPLTEQLRGCDTAGWEACATMVCHGFAGFTMKYPGQAKTLRCQPGRGRRYFADFSRWPPKPKRMAESTLSWKSASPRELKRA